jgi:hypothetical protein
MFTARTSMNHGIANTHYTWFALQVECWREVFGQQARARQNLNVTSTKLAWKQMARLLYISSLLKDEEKLENN